MNVQDNSAPPLAVDRLTVRYGKRTALAGVSLEVPHGSVYALLGRYGAGKSSLVRCALGQQKPLGGSAHLFANDAWRTRRRAMGRVGVLPETPDAPPSMTAPALSRLCAALYPRWDHGGVVRRLEAAGIPMGQPFHRLSKGEKSAVMLALVLGHAPELLVLDDPTLGLDAVARRALYDEIIGSLAEQGTTVFLTTHDLAGVETLADRVGILAGARLIVDEPLDALKSRFRRIRCPGAGATVDWAPFEVVEHSVEPWGAQAVVSNYDDARCAVLQAQLPEVAVEVAALSLEDIFVTLLAGREARS